MTRRILLAGEDYVGAYDDTLTILHNSPIATYTSAGVIAFVASDPPTITDTGNGFIAAGFLNNDIVKASDAPTNNDYFVIDEVEAGTLTMASIHTDSVSAESGGAGVISLDTPSMNALIGFDIELSFGDTHDRQHDMDDADDHNSPSGTTDNIVTFDADGFPVKDSGVAGSITHARSHVITGTSDHTSTATNGQMLKANASGLPIDATNTDAEVASAVSASHTRQHAMSSTSDHTTGGAALADLSLTITDPPTAGEVQDIANKVDAILSRLRGALVIAT